VILIMLLYCVINVISNIQPAAAAAASSEDMETRFDSVILMLDVQLLVTTPSLSM